MRSIKKLIIQYEKEYRAGNFKGAENLRFTLERLNVDTEFSVDHIFFTNCSTNEVIYSFET